MQDKLTIYLGGNISNAHKDTYKWREDFIYLAYKKYKRIKIINPCNNIWNTQSASISDDNQYLEQLAQKTQGLIQIHDYQLIRQSNIFVGNFGVVSPDKPMIGTIFELNWAFADFKIPTIGIMRPITTYTRHPWIRSCINYEAYSVIEAVDALEYLGCK